VISMAQVDEIPGRDLSPLKMGVVLFATSFAAVLFTLSVWKLLGFFIMPALFFDLLFIGFPIGALLAVRFLPVSLPAFRKTLWILQLMILLSVVACLAAKHFDYLRAHLFDVEISKLVIQIGTFSGLFLPYFCVYGMSEYIGYQLGRKVLKGRMSVVYGLVLFGAAAAYLFFETALHRQHLVGVSHMMTLALLLVALSTLLVSPRSAVRRLLGVELLVLAALLWAPGLEQRFLDLYKGEGFESTKKYTAQGHEPRFQRWGRYSLTEILYSPKDNLYTGFYNDLMQWKYTPGTGFDRVMLGAVPINLAGFNRPDSSIAIIGSGGGRQVQWALSQGFSFRRILALELEPAVIAAVRGKLRDEFDRVYEADPVEVHIGEARLYMQKSNESFDLIYLPSVGSYPQMMMEPGNMIRTLEAYRTLRTRLKDDGILAIWYPVGLDPQFILTRQYMRTLGQQGMGEDAMATRAYATYNDSSKGQFISEVLILAAKDPHMRLPTASRLEEFMRIVEEPSRRISVREIEVNDDPLFEPITDARPFLAGNIRNIFSLREIYLLFGMAAGLLVVIGVLLFVGLRKIGDPHVPGRSYGHVAALALLIGANFLVIEHFAVLVLFSRVYVYHQALVLGVIGFLVLTGLGSILIRRARGVLLVIAVLIMVGLSLFADNLTMAGNVLCLIPVVLVTGSLFPTLFEMASRNPLLVFAMDAVGSAAGAMLAYFIPVAFGFPSFFITTAVIFVATVLLTWRFYAPSLCSRNATSRD